MKILKRVLIIILGLLFVGVVSGGIYAFTYYQSAKKELAKTYKDYNTSKDQNDDAIKNSDPFTILLMGVDTGDSQRTNTWEGNSDSMILVTVNPKKKKTTMVSLERDAMVTLDGPSSNSATGTQAKLNAAYASGGTKMAIMTIQKLMDVTIDKYVQINMDGLVDLVNAVGGITVTNNFDYDISIANTEPEYTAVVEPGTHKINGEQALVYSRMRKEDPEGDYGRQKRQREVIQKVVEKLAKIKSPSKLSKIIKIIGDNVQTNIKLTASNLQKLMGYKDTLDNIKQYQLKGSDATIDGISYQMLDEDSLLTLQNTLKKSLGKATSTTLNSDNNAVFADSISSSTDSYNDYNSGSSYGSYNSYSNNTPSYNYGYGYGQ